MVRIVLYDRHKASLAVESDTLRARAQIDGPILLIRSVETPLQQSFTNATPSVVVSHAKPRERPVPASDVLGPDAILFEARLNASPVMLLLLNMSLQCEARQKWAYRSIPEGVKSGSQPSHGTQRSSTEARAQSNASLRSLPTGHPNNLCSVGIVCKEEVLLIVHQQPTAVGPFGALGRSRPIFRISVGCRRRDVIRLCVFAAQKMRITFQSMLSDGLPLVLRARS